MSELVEFTRAGRVVQVRLNRPAQRNALNTQLASELITGMEALDADPEVGCFVLTGDDRAFAAGADIAEMVGLSYAEAAARDFFGEWDRFVKLRTPRIAAVNGYALGGGCELMMMCDFAIAGEDAKFGQPEIKLGVIAGIGGTQRMTRLIGRSLAMDMHLTGRLMGAQEALRAGLVARVVADDQVLAEAMAAAAMIAGYSKPAAMLARDAVNRAEEGSQAEGLLFERRVFHSLFATRDQKEGMQAFLEKRTPEFSGT